MSDPLICSRAVVWVQVEREAVWSARDGCMRRLLYSGEMSHSCVRRGEEGCIHRRSSTTPPIHDRWVL